MAGGKKCVETIPAGWLDAIRPRAEADRHFKEAAAELMVLNTGQVKEYREMTRGFNPVKFDAAAYVLLAKAAGMKYLVVTA